MRIWTYTYVGWVEFRVSKSLLSGLTLFRFLLYLLNQSVPLLVVGEDCVFKRKQIHEHKQHLLCRGSFASFSSGGGVGAAFQAAGRAWQSPRPLLELMTQTLRNFEPLYSHCNVQGWFPRTFCTYLIFQTGAWFWGVVLIGFTLPWQHADQTPALERKRFNWLPHSSLSQWLREPGQELQQEGSRQLGGAEFLPTCSPGLSSLLFMQPGTTCRDGTTHSKLSLSTSISN